MCILANAYSRETRALFATVHMLEMKLARKFQSFQALTLPCISCVYIFWQSIETISFGELTLDREPMASGSSKTVFKATWAQGNKSPQQVAVLILTRGGNVKGEIGIFERLGRHPHLVRLLAMSTRPHTGDLCMVLEFAQRGSLDSVLQELSGPGAEQPTHSVLLTVACQVSCTFLF
jgi:hypothetical protein